MENLNTEFDSAKSFYNKAQFNAEDGKIVLYSYNSRVCEIKGGKAVIITEHPQVFSNTTLRHIKEFLKQKGFKAESKEQLIADYVEGY